MVDLAIESLALNKSLFTQPVTRESFNGCFYHESLKYFSLSLASLEVQVFFQTDPFIQM